MPDLSQQTPFWVKLLLNQGLAVFLVVLAALLARSWAKLYIKREYAKLDASLCKGTACPFRMEAEESVTIADLRHHRVWGFIQTALIHKIPSLRVPELGRKKISQRFLTIKFTAVRDSLLTVMAHPELGTMSGAEMDALFLRSFNEAVMRYESEAERIRVPRIFQDRFREIHLPNLDGLLIQTELISTSEWMDNNAQKVAIILDEVMSALRRALFDCEHTLATINGELDGYVFEGVTVQPIPGHKPKSVARITSGLSVRSQG